MVGKRRKQSVSCSFRVGEIYLNAAEAALMTGESAIPAARTYLLTLIKQRYKAAAYTEKETAINAMGRDELLQEIYDERTRELAFEGHRWFVYDGQPVLVWKKRTVGQPMFWKKTIPVTQFVFPVKQ